ncbi:MAG: DEAD/DEAH box helicase family protein [Armatimonadetes bacterium]|nr:DEAD/DEAH box helicase family protein [Armatimonadota bacterium]
MNSFGGKIKFESFDLEKLRKDNSFSTQKVLFPHQSEAIDALTRAFTFRNPQGKGGLLVLPTGAGKTFTSVKWLSETAIPKGAKILWLAHSFHLLDQACDEFKKNAKWIPFPRSTLNIRVVSSNPSHSRAGDIVPTDDVVIMTTPTASCPCIWLSSASFGYSRDSPIGLFSWPYRHSRLFRRDTPGLAQQAV